MDRWGLHGFIAGTGTLVGRAGRVGRTPWRTSCNNKSTSEGEGSHQQPLKGENNSGKRGRDCGTTISGGSKKITADGSLGQPQNDKTIWRPCCPTKAIVGFLLEQAPRGVPYSKNCPEKTLFPHFPPLYLARRPQPYRKVLTARTQSGVGGLETSCSSIVLMWWKTGICHVHSELR